MDIYKKPLPGPACIFAAFLSIILLILCGTFLGCLVGLVDDDYDKGAYFLGMVASGLPAFWVGRILKGILARSPSAPSSCRLFCLLLLVLVWPVWCILLVVCWFERSSWEFPLSIWWCGVFLLVLIGLRHYWKTSSQVRDVFALPALAEEEQTPASVGLLRAVCALMALQYALTILFCALQSSSYDAPALSVGILFFFALRLLFPVLVFACLKKGGTRLLVYWLLFCWFAVDLPASIADFVGRMNAMTGSYDIFRLVAINSWAAWPLLAVCWWLLHEDTKTGVWFAKTDAPVSFLGQPLATGVARHIRELALPGLCFVFLGDMLLHLKGTVSFHLAALFVPDLHGGGWFPDVLWELPMFGLFLCCCAGIWRGRYWAPRCCLLLLAVLLANRAVSLSFSSLSLAYFMKDAFLLCCWAGYFLLSPQVRKAFGVTAPPVWRGALPPLPSCLFQIFCVHTILGGIGLMCKLFSAGQNAFDLLDLFFSDPEEHMLQALAFTSQVMCPVFCLWAVRKQFPSVKTLSWGMTVWVVCSLLFSGAHSIFYSDGMKDLTLAASAAPFFTLLVFMCAMTVLKDQRVWFSRPLQEIAV